jgi:sugar/nucleoside kinase (ribokinase family)
MNPDLVAMGHLMNEIIRFPDQTILGPVLGGAAVYFSVVASRLETKTGIVSKIGTDMPMELLDPLHKSGVDTRGIIIEGNESRLSELIYEETGNKIMRYPKQGSPITLENIPDDYCHADIIYVCPQEWEVSLQVIEELSSCPAKLAVELGGYGGAHCSYHSGKKEDTFLKQILPYFHIAKLSNEDSHYLFQEKDEREVVEILIDWGVKISIVTSAEKGAIVATADEIFEIPAFTNKAVDCTGAGDCFAASFMVNYRKEHNVEKAGVFASAATSLLIEKRGGLDIERMPSLHQVEERLSQVQGRR